MNRYRKLIVAVVGLVALLLGPEFFGISEAGTIFGMPTDTVVELAVTVLTAFGVYQVTNA